MSATSGHDIAGGTQDELARRADRPDDRLAGRAHRPAPLRRLLRSELACLLHRARTWVALLVLALVPLAIGIGVAVGRRTVGPGPGLIAAATDNGLGVPVASLAVAQSLLLPLAIAVTAADALAGEAANGTLRGLLLAPVSRPRLVLVKAVGVLAMAVLGVLVVTVVGTGVGCLVVGGAGHLLTLSGTLVSTGSALGRILVAAGWTTIQLAAVGAIALAVSALTDRPVVVVGVVLGGTIVSGLLATIPALNNLHPLLLTAGWPALSDLLRDPIPPQDLQHGTVLALGYLVLGLAVAVTGMQRREF
ncbi:MAG TPA: ABC transporter permease subunit [Pseudonocardia sp.]